MHPTHRTISRFMLYTAPRFTAPPNGCLPRAEEVIETEVEIYEADYYGTGPTRHATGSSRVCDVDGGGGRPSFGGWSDGNSTAIARLEAQRDADAALAAAPLTAADLRAAGFELHGYESRTVGARYGRSAGALHRFAVYVKTGLTPHRVAVALRADAVRPAKDRRVVAWREGALYVGLVQDE